MTPNTPDALLTTDQLEILRTKLFAARDELVGHAPRISPANTPEAEDEMDLATRTSELEQSGARAERNRGRLSDINDAISKIHRGEYGLSEDSGEPIGFARLNILPWARLTVSEAEALERRR